MNDDIRIWEIDDSSKAATPVESTNGMETERSLEDVLVRNPDMLMPGLTLVGRQMPTDSGSLDLLGVDKDGRLVVFELKRGKPTRDVLSRSGRCLSGEVPGQARDDPLRVREAAQRAADEAGLGAVVLSVERDEVGDAQGVAHRACAGRA